MKKLFYFAMALSLVACQAEKVDVNGGENGDGEKNYISINIVSSASTRAADDEDDSYTANGGDYVDGTDDENKVSSVRFYFFKGNAPAKVIKNGDKFQSYYDINKVIDGTGEDHPNTVEKILETVIVIDVKGSDDGKRPGGDIADNAVSVVAILNPPAGLPTEEVTLEVLNAVAADYSAATNSNFIMSNSIYAYATKDGNKVFEAVSLEGHLYPDATSAKLNPVDIYVERVLAKVSLNMPATLLTTLQPTEGEALSNVFEAKDKDEKEIWIGGKKVYVQLLGWNVTATYPKSYLMKSISETWTDGTPFAGWNWAPIRSFWAINPSLIKDEDEDEDYQYGPFASETGAGAITNFTSATPNENEHVNYTYLQENAAQSADILNTKTPSKVIIAAKLVGADGKAFEVAEYAGTLYAGTEEVKKLYANALSNVWVESTDNTTAGQTDEEGKKYVKVGPENIDFITATAAGKASETQKGRYYVYAVLTEGNYYSLTTENGKTSAEDLDVNEVNKKLMDLGHAKVWKEGQTYYYFDIRHLNNTALTKQGEETDYDAQLRTPGYFGIVRNHVYKTTVNSILGLGTPVYNPGEVIIPEKPENDNTVIAAKIEILSWRIVANEYKLVW